MILISKKGLYIRLAKIIRHKQIWGSSKWLCIGGGGVNRPGEKLLKLGVTNASVSCYTAVHTCIWKVGVVTNM